MLETKDPKIINQMKEFLASDVGSAFQDKLAEQGGRDDLMANPEQLSNYDTTALKVYSVQMSSPLMSWESKEEVILKVEYKLPSERQRTTEYLRCEYRRLSKSLRFCRGSSVVSFYLNLI
jgi:hypothetical protein